MLLYLVLAVFGCGAGVTTVLFGFGGGFVVVPLMYRMLIVFYGADSTIGQWAMHIAVATSTCVMLFGAGMATWRHHLVGTIDWAPVRPLIAYMALGAVIGGIAATWMQSSWLRWCFVGYLAVTILDCVVRPGFMSAQSRAGVRPMSGHANAFAGVLIGWVAAFLGVGGSVMTVPLMRRRGAGMTQATAMANPLSLPVALGGTIAYMGMGASSTTVLGSGYIGYVDIRALVVLVVGAWSGVRLAVPYIGRIPDNAHAKIYLGLLSLVLVVMVVQ